MKSVDPLQINLIWALLDVLFTSHSFSSANLSSFSKSSSCIILFRRSRLSSSFIGKNDMTDAQSQMLILIEISLLMTIN